MLVLLAFEYMDVWPEGVAATTVGVVAVEGVEKGVEAAAAVVAVGGAGGVVDDRICFWLLMFGVVYK